MMKMPTMKSLVPRLRSPRLVAAARRNIMRAHVMRVGRRGTRYNVTRYPRPIRELIRSKRR